MVDLSTRIPGALEQTVSTPAVKRPYHTPLLKDYGAVDVLTLSSPSFNISSDGGITQPNFYASSN